MTWEGRYIVLGNGQLMWVEGYVFEPEDPVHELLEAEPKLRTDFQNFGSWGVRIGES